MSVKFVKVLHLEEMIPNPTSNPSPPLHPILCHQFIGPPAPPPMRYPWFDEFTTTTFKIFMELWLAPEAPNLVESWKHYGNWVLFPMVLLH